MEKCVAINLCESDCYICVLTSSTLQSIFFFILKKHLKKIDALNWKEETVLLQESNSETELKEAVLFHGYNSYSLSYGTGGFSCHN